MTEVSRQQAECPLERRQAQRGEEADPPDPKRSMRMNHSLRVSCGAGGAENARPVIETGRTERRYRANAWRGTFGVGIEHCDVEVLKRSSCCFRRAIAPDRQSRPRRHSE